MKKGDIVVCKECTTRWSSIISNICLVQLISKRNKDHWTVSALYPEKGLCNAFEDNLFSSPEELLEL